MKLTKAQRSGLTRIMDRGPEAWCRGTMGRAGGAIRRMFDRMAVDGLCSFAPYKITKKGRIALNGSGRK